MTWQEFNQLFDLSIFDELILFLNTGESELFNPKVSTKQTAVKRKKATKVRKKRIRIAYNHFQIEHLQYDLLPIECVNNRYIVKYSKKPKEYSSVAKVKLQDNYEELLLGYFQETEIGWLFVSLDSSHMWKRLREAILLKETKLDKLILGSNMFFCDLSKVEFDQRYYLLENGERDEDCFFFKSNCVRINDVYVGSNKSHRYFLVFKHAYTSNDFTTDDLISCDTYFENLKDLTNDEILMIFDQHDLKNEQDVMQRYSDKSVKKLLKL